MSETPSADLLLWMAQMRMHFDAVCDTSPRMRNTFMLMLAVDGGGGRSG